MSQCFTHEHPIGTIAITFERLGSDVVVCISGGDVAHVGSIVVASPRPSLTGSGRSATSSVINLPGHKDEFVARTIAETLAHELDATICCICGIHKNDATPEEIASCITLGDDIASMLLDAIEPEHLYPVHDHDDL